MLHIDDCVDQHIELMESNLLVVDGTNTEQNSEHQQPTQEVFKDEDEFALNMNRHSSSEQDEGCRLIESSSSPTFEEVEGDVALLPSEPNNPVQAVRRYFQRLIDVCSLRYLLYLGIIQLLVCGVFSSLMGSLFLPVFQKLGVDAATEQVLVLVCVLPYSAGPLIGAISDVIPLGGYHKKYWVISAILISSVGCILLILSDMSDVTSVVLGLVAMNLEVSVLNLLNEGKYSEIIKRHPDVAADIITLTQALSAIGSLVAMSFVGPLSDSGRLGTIITIALVLAVVPLFPALWGWLPETRRSRGENGLYSCCSLGCIMLDGDRLIKQRGTLGIALLVGFGGPILAVVSAYASRSFGIAAVTLLMLIILILSYATLPRVIANLVTYTILTKGSTPSLRSALQYFYTATDECWPEGPHFSYTYYITYNGVVGEVFMLTAIVFYQVYMTRWSYRSVLCSTLLLTCAGKMVDVILVKRWNLALGIPDGVFFILGSSMLESLTSMLHIMPYSAILSKVCPRGTETSTFAFVAGVGSFAAMWSSLVGAAAMDSVGLKTRGDDCDFSELPALIVFLSIALPLLVGLPSILLLIPDALQTESILRDEDGDEVVIDQEQLILGSNAARP